MVVQTKRGGWPHLETPQTKKVPFHLGCPVPFDFVKNDNDNFIVRFVVMTIDNKIVIFIIIVIFDKIGMYNDNEKSK